MVKKRPLLVMLDAFNNGEGGLFKIISFFVEIHNNFPNFSIAPISTTEQEIGFVSTILKAQHHLFPDSTLLSNEQLSVIQKMTEMKRDTAETSFPLA